MYLIDTNVLSEARKQRRADSGVARFFDGVATRGEPVYLSAITLGELRRGVESIRHRGDLEQAERLERWLHTIVWEYEHCILPIESEAAQVWGKLRVPHPGGELDKQTAAIALVNDLVVVTRNVGHFEATRVRVLNPFSAG